MADKGKEPVEEIELDDDEEGMDPIEYIGAFLHTEEGETITQVLSNISKHLEMQNKILVKILTSLSTPKNN
jgi:hypothetical protein